MFIVLWLYGELGDSSENDIVNVFHNEKKPYYRNKPLRKTSGLCENFNF